MSLNKTMWNKFIKGMYHTTTDWPVDEACFGDETVYSMETFGKISYKVKEMDFFGIT